MTVIVRLLDGNRIAFAQNDFSILADNTLKISDDVGKVMAVVHPHQWTSVERDLPEPEVAE